MRTSAVVLFAQHVCVCHVDVLGGPKNEATLHFAEYLENYQRYLHDFCTYQE